MNKNQVESDLYDPFKRAKRSIKYLVFSIVFLWVSQPNSTLQKFWFFICGCCFWDFILAAPGKPNYKGDRKF